MQDSDTVTNVMVYKVCISYEMINLARIFITHVFDVLLEMMQ